MEIKPVLKKEILRDFFFCFSSLTVPEALKVSIRKSGVLQPLQVIRSEAGYQLLSGFRRLQAAEELNLHQLPAIVYPEDAPRTDLLYGAVLENSVHRKLNLVEKAKILRILKRLNSGQSGIEKRFLHSLSIPDSEKQIRKIEEILSLTNPLQAYIERYNIPLKQTDILFKLSAGEQAFFMHLAEALQIRPVELTAMITDLYECSRRDKKEIPNLYKELNPDEVFGRSDLSKRQKLGSIRQKIQHLRYPKLTDWNTRLQSLASEIRLAGGQLSWDRNLEDPGIRLQFSIRSKEEYERMRQSVGLNANRDKILQMLEMV